MRRLLPAFTLLELLIAVSIITLVSGALIPAFSAYAKNQNLKQAQQQLKNDLRTLQTNALTGTGASELIGGTTSPRYWAVRLQQDQQKYSYYLAYDTACPPAQSIAKGTSQLLPGDIKVASATTCLFFLFGNADSPTQSTITLSNDDESKCATVTLNTNGLITFSGAITSCP